MNEALVEQQAPTPLPNRPGHGRKVSILGVPLGFGASTAGVDIGPAALRVARLNPRIAQLGYEVRDLGDMRIPRPSLTPEPNEKLKFLNEISAACEELATEVHKVLESGELPIILGGDHSVAIGSIAR